MDHDTDATITVISMTHQCQVVAHLQLIRAEGQSIVMYEDEVNARSGLTFGCARNLPLLSLPVHYR